MFILIFGSCVLILFLWNQVQTQYGRYVCGQDHAYKAFLIFGSNSRQIVFALHQTVFPTEISSEGQNDLQTNLRVSLLTDAFSFVFCYPQNTLLL